MRVHFGFNLVHDLDRINVLSSGFVPYRIERETTDLDYRKKVV